MGFVMCVVYNLCCCPCIIRILNMRSRKYQQRQQAIQDLTKRQRDQELAKNKEMLKRFNVPFTNSTPPAGSQVQVARPI
uniref:Uncharacterized protein n=1 Tax=Arundo donax TaxID=35708 RepID=A0A0A8ZFM1_ARUDO